MDSNNALATLEPKSPITIDQAQHFLTSVIVCEHINKPLCMRVIQFVKQRILVLFVAATTYSDVRITSDFAAIIKRFPLGEIFPN